MSSTHKPGLFGSYFLLGYALMTSFPASPEPPPNRLRADQVSGRRHLLTDSSAPSEAAARPLWQMPPTAAACDLAYTRL